MGARPSTLPVPMRRARIVTVPIEDGSGGAITGTVAELEALGYGFIMRNGVIECQHEPRRVGINPPPTTPRPNIRPAPQHPRAPATGPTLRLLRRCRACGDALPPDASFCIMCRAPVKE